MFFILLPLFYIPGCIYVQRIPNGVDNRTILITASFIAFVNNLFVGPSKMLFFPDNVWIMGLGQILRGFFDPFTCVPALPEMID
jgi:hypothetical protein